MADNDQSDNPHELDVENDPRGGVQSEEYRTADPRDVVEEGETTMSAPGGAPQEGLSWKERKRLSEALRRKTDNH